MDLKSTEDSTTIENDAAKLLAFMDLQGLHASTEVRRGWEHIGAIIVDAALQRRQKYNATVKPRVEALITEWPDASTTSGFRRHLASGQLSEVIRWPSPGRLAQIDEITAVLERQQIETVAELREALTNQQLRQDLREALSRVQHVGPKTLDYFDILSGKTTGVAIDSRIRRTASLAGIEDMAYEHLAAVIRKAAESRGWRVGDLDAVLWTFEQPASADRAGSADANAS